MSRSHPHLLVRQALTPQPEQKSPLPWQVASRRQHLLRFLKPQPYVDPQPQWRPLHEAQPQALLWQCLFSSQPNCQCRHALQPQSLAWQWESCTLVEAARCREGVGGHELHG